MNCLVKRIIDGINAIINSPPPLGRYGPRVVYDGTGFIILSYKSYTVSYSNWHLANQTPIPTTNAEINVILEHEIKNNIYLEIKELLNKCKSIFGKQKEFDELKSQLFKDMEFQDFLETL